MKYVVEFIGTFFLMTAIGMAVVEPAEGTAAPAAGDMAPLAIGSMLTAMVFAGGHVSGAHYNPAVTLAVFLRGKCPAKDVGPYMAVQLIAAAAAAALVLSMKGNPTVEAGNPDIIRALIAEFLFTFALCYVVLNVATARGTSGNSFYGLAIGFIVLAGAYAVGGISGGAFNPAVAVGITVLGLSAAADIWIFLVANFAAGAAAAFAFQAINPHDKD